MTETATPPRFEFESLPGGLRIGIHPSKKRKTILVRAYFAADLDRTAAERTLLSQVLRRGTRSLPDYQQVQRRLEWLYGAILARGIQKIGEWHVSYYQIEVVNERFLPDGAESLFEEGVALLRDLLFDTDLGEDGHFPAARVEREQKTLEQQIESLIEDKSSWAHFRLVEEMCPDEPYRLSELGQIEDVAAATPAALAEAHARWLRHDPLTIYVTGDLEVERARSVVATAFAPERSGEITALRRAAEPRPVARAREVREELDVNQSKLLLGYRHGVTYRSSDYEALLLMNGVLGGFSHSKLFQNVREKASLAYSANSWPERQKGLLFIHCGCAHEQVERARDLILEQVEALKRGDITEEEIEATRLTLLNHNRMLEDDSSSLAAVDYVWQLGGRALELDVLRRRLAAVEREDIVRVAERLELDTVYRLEGPVSESKGRGAGTSASEGDQP